MRLGYFLVPVFVMTFVLPKPLFACSCALLGDSFFETVFLHNQKVETGEWPDEQELTIVTAEVTDYLHLRPGPVPTEMVLAVSNVVQGSLDVRDLVVEGDNGFQCRPYVTEFSLGESYILL